MRKYKLNKGYIFQKLQGKTIIFDGEKSVIYTFNEIASFIFQKIKSGSDRSEITGSIIRKYKVDKITAGKDIAEFITDLKKKKIITEINK